MSRLQKRYKEEVKNALQERFKYANTMLIPSLRKIVISMGLAEATKDKNALQDCFKEMANLSGQKPVFTKARKSVANFKLREGQAIGLKVTLRKKTDVRFLGSLLPYRFPAHPRLSRLSDKMRWKRELFIRH